MPKAKSKTNRPTEDQLALSRPDSTCKQVHPSYTHGNLNESHGSLRTTQKGYFYWCPEKDKPPNPMHNNEYMLHLKDCIHCQKRTGSFGLTKNTNSKKK